MRTLTWGVWTKWVLWVLFTCACRRRRRIEAVALVAKPARLAQGLPDSIPGPQPKFSACAFSLWFLRASPKLSKRFWHWCVWGWNFRSSASPLGVGQTVKHDCSNHEAFTRIVCFMKEDDFCLQDEWMIIFLSQTWSNDLDETAVSATGMMFFQDLSRSLQKCTTQQKLHVMLSAQIFRRLLLSGICPIKQSIAEKIASALWLIVKCQIPRTMQQLWC